ncbi:MAG: hypothetical protein ABI091_14805 [Ferruginibacter sp.]
MIAQTSYFQQDDKTLVESLWTVMRKEKRKAPPVLIFHEGNFLFNGVNYGSDEGAANKERRKYFEQIQKQ